MQGTIRPHEDVAKPDVGGHKSTASAQNSRRVCLPVLAITGVALCLGFASCTTPHDSRVVGSGSVTTYQPGYTVASLPGGYHRETISGNTYYYHDGYYYNRGSGGYVVVDAPRGSRYYSDYDRRQRNSQPGYVQGRQGDQFITRLPRGYREVNHNGQTYYQAGDQYYRRDNNGYVVIRRPY